MATETTKADLKLAEFIVSQTRGYAITLYPKDSRVQAVAEYRRSGAVPVFKA